MASLIDPKTPPEVTPSEAQERAPDPKKRLERGTLVGRYTILEPLGTGGYATVYSAYDAELQRTVALKMLQADVELQEVRRRVFGEAQAMARLKHPNVVTVYEVGKFHRQIYIVMECVEGSTLASWVKTPRAWREVLSKLKSAGRGLAAAHEAGLVHRDFKPENVLVGNDGRVLVSDFGIARPAEEAGDVGAPSAAGNAPQSPGQAPSLSGPISTRPEDPLTETGRVMGTHGYLAPERLVSAADDMRSDQFSFAVSMFVALYGTHPFVFTNVASYSKAVRGAPETPPPSTKVPGWVHAVIERGLKPDPEQRFTSMKELLEALERDPSRRRRTLAAGACLAATFAVALTAYGRHRVELRARASEGASLMAATWNAKVEQLTRTSLAAADPRYGSVIAEQTARRIGEYATAWTDTHRRISEATLLQGEQDALAMARRLRCLERGREQLSALREILLHADAAVAQRAIDATFALPNPANCANSDVANIPALPSAPDTRARVLEAERAAAQAHAYAEVGQDQKAEDIIARVLPEVRAIPYARTEAELLLIDADAKLQLSDKNGALEAAQGAFRAALRAGDDALAVRAATSIVTLLCNWFHKPEEGKQWLELANAIVDRAGRNDATDAEILLAQAVINATSGHPDQNAELFGKHLAILERLYGERDPRVARASMDLGVCLALVGQYEVAAKTIQRGIDLLAALGGDHNPRLALYYMNLGGAHQALGRSTEAKGAYEHGLALLVDRPPGPLSVVLLGQLATIETLLGHIDAAVEVAQKGVDVAAAIGEKGRFAWHVRQAHAEARGKKGDYRGQATECAEIIASQRAADQVAANVPYFPDALACLAEAEIALGKVDSALSHLEQSVKLESRTDVEALPKARFALAKALRIAGHDGPRARKLAESAREDLGKAAGKEPDIAMIDDWLGGQREAVVAGR
jgi:tetratricopeptide (TPR) repeat protein